MFTKRKLAKLIEKKETNKQEINYEILQKAKKETHWNNACEVKVIDNRKQKLIISAVICCLLILISLGIYLGITLSKAHNGIDPPIYYSYNEDNIYKYESIDKYNKDNNLNLLYFKDYKNIDEVVKVYKDKDQDVLLNQGFVLLDTFERIELNIELKSNYFFVFLKDFDLLESNVTVNGVQISFNTYFDKDIYLYKTFAKFNYNGYIYKVFFEMEEKLDWQQEINKLLA